MFKLFTAIMKKISPNNFKELAEELLIELCALRLKQQDKSASISVYSNLSAAITILAEILDNRMGNQNLEQSAYEQYMLLNEFEQKNIFTRLLKAFVEFSKNSKLILNPDHKIRALDPSGISNPCIIALPIILLNKGKIREHLEETLSTINETYFNNPTDAVQLHNNL